MQQIFHREKIFYDPYSAWERYRNNPACHNFPERITVEVTNRCNLSCFMCPRNKIKMDLGDMQLELFKKIIDEAAHFLPVCLVPFFRGESFLHPQFFEMLAYAKLKGLRPLQLATNGYFLTPERAGKILDMGVDFISFSLDVNHQDIYKKIRQQSDFERVFFNVFNFLKEKQDRNYNLPQIQVSAVKTRRNAAFINDFIGFWQDKVDKVRVYYAHSLEGKLGQITESDNAQAKRMPCLKLLTDIVIYYNGGVALCNHDWQRESSIGNIKNSSIQDLWRSPYYSAIREKHLCNKLNDFSPCNYCSHWRAYYQKDYIIGEAYERDKVSAH